MEAMAKHNYFKRDKWKKNKWKKSVYKKFMSYMKTWKKETFLVHRLM